jgi:hypothetical protein
VGIKNGVFFDLFGVVKVLVFLAIINHHAQEFRGAIWFWRKWVTIEKRWQRQPGGV